MFIYILSINSTIVIYHNFGLRVAGFQSSQITSGNFEVAAVEAITVERGVNREK